jgi:hypothetical protein
MDVLYFSRVFADFTYPRCHKLFTVLAGLRIFPSADKDLDPASENAPAPDPTLEVALDADIGRTEIGVVRRKMSN